MVERQGTLESSEWARSILESHLHALAIEALLMPRPAIGTLTESLCWVPDDCLYPARPYKVSITHAWLRSTLMVSEVEWLVLHCSARTRSHDPSPG